MKTGTRYQQLSYKERVKIATLRERGESIRTIATVVGRSPTTVAVELREKQVRGAYLPKKAHAKTHWRRYHSKRECMKVAMSRELTELVNAKLPLGWSPERIAGYAARQVYAVSKKAVYKHVKSRCLKRHLFWKRYKKHGGPKRSNTSPADQGKREVERRPTVLSSGHWELDFIVPRQSAAVLFVMVDRWTRYTIVIRLKCKTHQSVYLVRLLILWIVMA